MNKVILLFVSFVFSLSIVAQNEYDYILNESDSNKVVSASGNATLWFEKSYCYVKLKYSVNADELRKEGVPQAVVTTVTKSDTNWDNSVTTSTKVAAQDISNIAYSFNYSLYKDKKETKKGEIIGLLSYSNTKLTFIVKGLNAYVSQLTFTKHCKKNDVLVINIPTETESIKEIFDLKKLKWE